MTLVGYVRGDFGVAENLRSVAGCLKKVSYPYDIYEVDAGDTYSKTNNNFSDLVTNFSNKRIQLYCVNADQLLNTQKKLGANKTSGTYRIGYWFWELSNFPSNWMHAFDLVDEVWAPSKFIFDSLSKATTKPVVYMPVAVDFQMQAKYSRNYFKLPQNSFLFLVSFDFHSFSERKNSEAVIQAFQNAFSSENENVGLVIKTIYGEKHPEKYTKLLDLAKNDARIIVVNSALKRDEMYGLIDVCDCYVSLHRSEGFGLGIAEAMYLSKPVIVTAYSGNMDFTNQDTSCLVEFDLVEVALGNYPFWQGQYWAEPNINQASEYMVKVYSDSKFRNNMSFHAKSLVEQQHSHAVVGNYMRTRLSEISSLKS